MIYADWVLLGLVAISMLVGLWRGFIKEVLDLAVWVAAFLVAMQFSAPVSELLENQVSTPSARTAIAFAGLFLGVLIVGGLFNWIVGRIVAKTGLSGSDRILGAAFGLLRGALVIVALVLVAGFTPLPQDPWWDDSRVVQSALPLAAWAAQFLPDTLTEYFDLYQVAASVPDLHAWVPRGVVESPAT